MKQFTRILLTLIASSIIACNPSNAQQAAPAKLTLKTYSDWETTWNESTSEPEFYTLTIPDCFQKNDAVTIQLYDYSVGDSTISLIGKDGNLLTAISESVTIHEMAIRYTSVSVGDIDCNGLNDMKINFPYMGNGLMANAKRIVYLFQNADRTFSKVSFDSFTWKNDIMETDADGDGKYEIVVRNIQNIDDDNYYWVENLYKYTANGLVCVSDKNGYPKAYNVDKEKATDAEIVAKHKKEWTVPIPDGYNFTRNNK